MLLEGEEKNKDFDEIQIVSRIQFYYKKHMIRKSNVNFYVLPKISPSPNVYLNIKELFCDSVLCDL